jgi:hypothetical protein
MNVKDDPINGGLKYTNKEGVVQFDFNFSEGVKDGPCVLRYENGQKMLEGFWLHGKMEGSTITWFPNGQRQQEVQYHQGLKHGFSRSWFENGRIKEEKCFKLDQPTGIWREWNEAGELIKDEMFDNNSFRLIEPTSLAVKFDFYKTVQKNKYFFIVMALTLINIFIGIFGIYFAEVNSNPKLINLSDAVNWFFSTLPLISISVFKPLSISGYVIGIIVHVLNFILLSAWSALACWFLFSKAAYKIAQNQLNRLD